MLIKRTSGIEIPSSQITPKQAYFSRRTFMKSATAVAAGTLLAACRPEPPTTNNTAESVAAGDAPAESSEVSITADELGDPLNSYQDVTNFNNFYEFTQSKEDVARLAADFPTSPWQVEVKGLVNNPGTYDIADMLKKFEQQDRVYRLRCVEGWSMVIPWQGFSLAQLLQEAEPTAQATHVRFETLHDPDKMPGQRGPWFEWPYVEGLRLDEAMNDLTLMATGLYGESLLPQNGAPIRLVVPWKYGFKSIKSIVRIELVDYQPTSLWMAASPNEYGFYANVNPTVAHPRWSQATERRIGTSNRRETLMFNGYEEQVAHLYDNLDLKVNY